MTNEQRMVTEFHRAFAIAIGTSPSLPDATTCSLRLRLLYQSCEEIQDALAQQDLAGTAQGLAELLYIVYGTAISCGIDLDPVFQEVHRSNMSKVGVYQNANGAWVKPSHYSPPYLQPILTAQQSEEWEQGDLHIELFDGELSPPLPPPELRGISKPGPDLSQDHLPYPLQPDITLEFPIFREPKPGEHTTKAAEYIALDCPQCGKDFIRRSKRKGMIEGLLSLIRRYPFRCRVCGHRFKAFQFRKSHPGKQRKNHRFSKRQSVKLPVTFEEVANPGESRRGQGVIRELSHNGCFLHTSSRLSQGTLLSLQIQLPAQALPLHVELAVVRSVRLVGVGLEFLRLDKPEHKRLTQFVQGFLMAPQETTEEDE